MNKEDYIKEGERQLQQQQHYKKLDDFEKTKKKLIKEVETSLRSLKSREYIDDDIFKLLFRPNPRTSNLYLLPKIYKKNNPGRPIINSVGSLTETISALVDKILRKYSKLAGSHIKDTSRFLQEIQNIKIHSVDTPTPKCHGIRSLLVVLFLPKLRVVPHGTKGTGPKFITRPVCVSS